MHYTATQKFHIMAIIFILPFLMGLGIDLYVPSLPAIAKYFQVRNNLVQLTISVYVLAGGIGHLILGITSDSVGRRKIILICAIFYTIVSFLSAFTSHIYLLLCYRFLQGLGIAGLAVVSRAVATDIFSGKDLAKAMTYFSIAWAMGPILGPFIGGYLQHYFNWQANFYFFGGYGLLAFIYLWFFLPETHFNLSPPNPGEIYRNIKKVALHPIFLLGMLILAFVYSALILFSMIGPFLIQGVLKYSAIAYGNMALMLGVGYFSGNLSNRFLLNYFAPMQIAIFGIIGGILTSTIMLFLGLILPMSIYIITTPILLLLFSCALIFPNIQAKCFGLFPEHGGIAGAVYGFFAIAVGSALLTIFAKTLPTNSQIPMAFTYLGLLLLCLSLYLIICYLEKYLIIGYLNKETLRE